MTKIPVTNNTQSNMHVGGSVLRPGETQLVEPHLVPPEQGEISAQAELEEETDRIALQAAVGAPDIISVIPDQSDEHLAEIEANEHAGKNRSTVLEAVTAERLRRAADTSAPTTATAAAEQQVAAKPADAAAPPAAAKAAGKKGK